MIKYQQQLIYKNWEKDWIPIGFSLSEDISMMFREINRVSRSKIDEQKKKYIPKYDKNNRNISNNASFCLFKGLFFIS